MYEKEKVKDGVFQAMMDVALVNDGPVGLNFVSLDGEVSPLSRFLVQLTDEFKVTIEINSDPPPMDLPSSTSTSLNTTLNMADLGSELKRLSAEFKLPPELLE